MTIDRAAHSLDERRQQLLARSAVLRECLAQDIQAWQPAARKADAAARFARQTCQQIKTRHPLLMLAGAALAGAALTRPRRLLGLAGSAWSAWQIYQRARPLLALARKRWL